jgi:hypothetical protein
MPVRIKLFMSYLYVSNKLTILAQPSSLWGHAVAWLRHYGTSQKIMGSITDESIGFLDFSIYLILPVALWSLG